MASPATPTIVLHPEATAIKETRRAIDELSKLGIHTHELIVNGIIRAPEAANPLFAARRQMQQGYLAQVARELPLPTRQMALLDGEIKGVARLRVVGSRLFDGRSESAMFGTLAHTEPAADRLLVDLADVLPRLLPNGHRRTIFFAGKGGVGKTAASCATAIWLARQDYRTLLLTTDPAAHLGDVLGVPVGDAVAPVAGVPNLFATRIDPKAAGEAYKARILSDARARGRAPR